MKKLFLLLLVCVMPFTALLAQNSKSKAEVLYFKANLACCKAKACNVLETDIKTIIEKNYPDGKVIFREIKLADEANKALVEKYQAGSQTVIIVAKKKKKEKSINVSDLIKTYLQNQDKVALEKQLIEKINGIL